VIHFSPACTKIYLGSPSLVKLDNGDWLAAMDMFGPNAPKPSVSMIFRSTDGGKKWRFVTDIEGSFWANLFTHRGALYFLGCSEGNGSIVIRRSLDGGTTWTSPRDGQSGLLFAEGPDAGYHCAPMPVVEHRGRLYRAFENNATNSWPDGFRSFVISADADADLLLASSWTMSNQLVYDQESDPPEFARGAENLPGGKAAGWLEGNVVVTPEGNLVNILRVNSLPVVDRAAVVQISDGGRKVRFDPQTGFINFPGGMTKFAIRRDPVTGIYWTLANKNINPRNPTQRNSLQVHSSKDLREWVQHEVVLEDQSDFDRIGNDSKVGFQYVDFQFNGDDLVFQSRTACQGAHNYHDANYMTFHRIPNFRTRYSAASRRGWKEGR